MEMVKLSPFVADNIWGGTRCLQYTLHQGDHIGKEVTECSRQKM